MSRPQIPSKWTLVMPSDDDALHLQGTGLLLARMGWIAVVVPAYALFIATLPSYFVSLHTLYPPSSPFTVLLSPSDVHLLKAWGLSLDFYAIAMFLSSLLFQFCYAFVGIVLFWRKSNDRAALLTSFALMMLPFGFSDVILQTLPPSWLWLIPVLSALGNGSLISCGFVFPDGQFIPRWSRWLALALLVYYLMVAIFPSWQIDRSMLSLSLFLGFAISAMLTQLYRYRYVSTPRQRQQTRWAVFGVVITALGNILPRLLYNLVLSPLSYSSPLAFALEINLIMYPMLSIPITLGIAILFSHLWDIDVIINRTLVYGTLTTTLALVYTGLVFALQFVLHGFISLASDSDVALVGSTLATAALFQPLRHRLQQIIDRHFYRRKYNAARTLATLSATLRDEVDLNQVRAQLLSVVEETMQPTHTLLWLRSSEKPKKKNSGMLPKLDQD